jgi:DNA-directed RNA polymerase specialized sigma24 family protein
MAESCASLVMNWQEVLKYVDDLLFSQTGQHLDSLQIAILKGVFENQKYAQIAKECNCTEGHVKDEAYALWQKLSETLQENLNKSNFRATIERIVITNSAVTVHGNQIGSINLCPNSSQTVDPDSTQTVDPDSTQTEADLVGEESLNALENVRKKAKLEVVADLAQLGLTAEQIAQSLGLSLDDVKQLISE